MVTMSSDKLVCRRKPAENNTAKGGTEQPGGRGRCDVTFRRQNSSGQSGNASGETTGTVETSTPATWPVDTPNYLVYQKVRLNFTDAKINLKITNEEKIKQICFVVEFKAQGEHEEHDYIFW